MESEDTSTPLEAAHSVLLMGSTTDLGALRTHNAVQQRQAQVVDATRRLLQSETLVNMLQEAGVELPSMEDVEMGKRRSSPVTRVDWRSALNRNQAMSAPSGAGAPETSDPGECPPAATPEDTPPTATATPLAAPGVTPPRSPRKTEVRGGWRQHVSRGGGPGEGGVYEKNPVVRRLKKLRHKVLFGKVGEMAYTRYKATLRANLTWRDILRPNLSQAKKGGHNQPGFSRWLDSAITEEQRRAVRHEAARIIQAAWRTFRKSRVDSIMGHVRNYELGKYANWSDDDSVATDELPDWWGESSESSSEEDEDTKKKKKLKKKGSALKRSESAVKKRSVLAAVAGAMDESTMGDAVAEGAAKRSSKKKKKKKGASKGDGGEGDDGGGEGEEGAGDDAEGGEGEDGAEAGAEGGEEGAGGGGKGRRRSKKTRSKSIKGDGEDGDADDDEGGDGNGREAGGGHRGEETPVLKREKTFKRSKSSRRLAGGAVRMTDDPLADLVKGTLEEDAVGGGTGAGDLLALQRPSGLVSDIAMSTSTDTTAASAAAAAAAALLAPTPVPTVPTAPSPTPAAAPPAAAQAAQPAAQSQPPQKGKKKGKKKKGNAAGGAAAAGAGGEGAGRESPPPVSAEPSGSQRNAKSPSPDPSALFGPEPPNKSSKQAATGSTPPPGRTSISPTAMAPLSVSASASSVGAPVVPSLALLSVGEDQRKGGEATTSGADDEAEDEDGAAGRNTQGGDNDGGQEGNGKRGKRKKKRRSGAGGSHTARSGNAEMPDWSKVGPSAALFDARTDPDKRATLLARMARDGGSDWRPPGAMGDWFKMSQFIYEGNDPDKRGEAMAKVAEAVASTGQPLWRPGGAATTQWYSMSRSLYDGNDPGKRAEALTRVVAAPINPMWRPPGLGPGIGRPKYDGGLFDGEPEKETPRPGGSEIQPPWKPPGVPRIEYYNYYTSTGPSSPSASSASEDDAPGGGEEEGGEGLSPEEREERRAQRRAERRAARAAARAAGGLSGEGSGGSLGNRLNGRQPWRFTYTVEGEPPPPGNDPAQAKIEHIVREEKGAPVPWKYTVVAEPDRTVPYNIWGPYVEASGISPKSQRSESLLTQATRNLAEVSASSGIGRSRSGTSATNTPRGGASVPASTAATSMSGAVPTPSAGTALSKEPSAAQAPAWGPSIEVTSADTAADFAAAADDAATADFAAAAADAPHVPLVSMESLLEKEPTYAGDAAPYDEPMEPADDASAPPSPPQPPSQAQSLPSQPSQPSQPQQAPSQASKGPLNKVAKQDLMRRNMSMPQLTLQMPGSRPTNSAAYRSGSSTTAVIPSHIVLAPEPAVAAAAAAEALASLMAVSTDDAEGALRGLPYELSVMGRSAMPSRLGANNSSDSAVSGDDEEQEGEELPRRHHTHYYRGRVSPGAKQMATSGMGPDAAGGGDATAMVAAEASAGLAATAAAAAEASAGQMSNATAGAASDGTPPTAAPSGISQEASERTGPLTVEDLQQQRRLSAEGSKGPAGVEASASTLALGRDTSGMSFSAARSMSSEFSGGVTQLPVSRLYGNASSAALTADGTLSYKMTSRRRRSHLGRRSYDAPYEEASSASGVGGGGGGSAQRDPPRLYPPALSANAEPSAPKRVCSARRRGAFSTVGIQPYPLDPALLRCLPENLVPNAQRARSAPGSPRGGYAVAAEDPSLASVAAAEDSTDTACGAPAAQQPSHPSLMLNRGDLPPLPALLQDPRAQEFLQVQGSRIMAHRRQAAKGAAQPDPQAMYELLFLGRSVQQQREEQYMSGTVAGGGSAAGTAAAAGAAATTQLALSPRRRAAAAALAEAHTRAQVKLGSTHPMVRMYQMHGMDPSPYGHFTWSRAGEPYGQLYGSPPSGASVGMGSLGPAAMGAAGAAVSAQPPVVAWEGTACEGWAGSPFERPTSSSQGTLQHQVQEQQPVAAEGPPAMRTNSLPPLAHGSLGASGAGFSLPLSLLSTEALRRSTPPAMMQTAAAAGSAAALGAGVTVNARLSYTQYTFVPTGSMDGRPLAAAEASGQLRPGSSGDTAPGVDGQQLAASGRPLPSGPRQGKPVSTPPQAPQQLGPVLVRPGSRPSSQEKGSRLGSQLQRQDEQPGAGGPPAEHSQAGRPASARQQDVAGGGGEGGPMGSAAGPGTAWTMLPPIASQQPGTTPPQTAQQPQNPAQQGMQFQQLQFQGQQHAAQAALNGRQRRVSTSSPSRSSTAPSPSTTNTAARAAVVTPRLPAVGQRRIGSLTSALALPTGAEGDGAGGDRGKPLRGQLRVGRAPLGPPLASRVPDKPPGEATK